jgi:hypothetical protein
MFPGNPRNRENCRVYPIANAATRIALKGDDPDFIILELQSAVTGASVTLPNTAPLGKTFTFVLTANPHAAPAITTHSVTINVPGAQVLAAFTWTLRAGQEVRFIYTPKGWLTPRGILAGSDGVNSSSGVAVGDSAAGASLGVAIGGGGPQGYTNGVAVGYGAAGLSSGVAVGFGSVGSTNGVAVGYTASTNTKDAAVALGYMSKAERYRELVKSADRATTCLQSFSTLDWYGDTADATPTELLLGGVAAQYAVLLNSSAFAFRIQAIARNNVDDVGVWWVITGGIRRGANAAATAIIGTNVTTTDKDGVLAWALTATADTTNGSLKITATGEAAKTIRWNVRGDISELRF